MRNEKEVVCDVSGHTPTSSYKKEIQPMIVTRQVSKKTAGTIQEPV